MKNMVSTLVFAAVLALSTVGVSLARAEKPPVNACGCRGEGNNCSCERKAKCGCPGECEPKGCEEARQKEMEKEIAAETKKAKEAEQAHNKSKEEGKADDAAGGDKGEKQSGPPKGVKPMTAVQKKQLQKLLDAYLVEHPEGKNKMLWELRAEL
jgi:hypothetical protein